MATRCARPPRSPCGNACASHRSTMRSRVSRLHCSAPTHWPLMKTSWNGRLPRADRIAMSGERPFTLARYLFVAYALLVVYASLHPFSGWRDRGLPPLGFLTAPFPRPIQAFDVIANIIGYVPLGFLAVMAAYPALRSRYAFAFGFAFSLLLSFTLELLQLYLPTRTSSNLDLLANAAGGALGALAAL